VTRSEVTFMNYALNPRVRELCSKASKEQDPVQLLRLMTELNNLLEASDEGSRENPGNTTGRIGTD
jgi:hypothetical protein